MSNAIQKFFIIIPLMVSISTIYAFNFGGNIDNATSYSTDDEYGFSQIDRLSMWLEAGKGNNFNFQIQGSCTFSNDIIFYADLDLLLLTGQKKFEKNPSLFRYSFGRFTLSDFTKEVLFHRIDGLKMSFCYPAFVFSFGFGYTGLLLRPTSNIVLNRIDDAEKEDDDVWLGSPRLIALMELQFPDIFTGQDLFASIILQKDVRNKDDMVKEGTEDTVETDEGGYYDSIYFGAGLSGGIVSLVFYEAFFYIQTGRTLSYIEDDDSSTGYSYTYKPIISFLIGTSFNFYVEKLLYSNFGLLFLLGYGDSDYSSYLEGNTQKNSTLFVPISNLNHVLAFNPNLSNIILVQASYSLKPFSFLKNRITENLLFYLGFTIFLRPTEGAISEYGLNADSDSRYLGSEMDFIINFRPFSDFGSGLGFGFFFPSAGSGKAFNGDERNFEFFFRFDVSFSF